MDTGPISDSGSGRIMSIDLGRVRVGIGLSDFSRTLATPYQSLHREKVDSTMISKILKIAEEETVNEIIVGVPKNLKIEKNLAELSALEFIEKLRDSTSLPIVPVDERFTTVLANKRLRDIGLNSKTMRSKVDASAAAEMLQEYLDQRGKS